MLRCGRFGLAPLGHAQTCLSASLLPASARPLPRGRWGCGSLGRRCGRSRFVTFLLCAKCPKRAKKAKHKMCVLSGGCSRWLAVAAAGRWPLARPVPRSFGRCVFFAALARQNRLLVALYAAVLADCASRYPPRLNCVSASPSRPPRPPYSAAVGAALRVLRLAVSCRPPDGKGKCTAARGRPCHRTNGHDVGTISGDTRGRCRHKKF